MQIARLAVAVCALLVLVGCGISHSSEAAQPPERPATPTVAAERSDYLAADGSRKSIGNGVALTISPPTSFTPTDTAYPRANRAIAFEITIDNGSSVTYRPADLSFTATVDGVETERVIDSTQGYPDTSGLADEVAPDESLRIAVAFVVPDKPCQLRVTVLPGAVSATPILLYEGTV